MSYDKWYAEQRKKYVHIWSSEKRESLKIAWDAAIKECAEKAENIKSPKFTKSWNEACDEIAKEIRKAK